MRTSRRVFGCIVVVGLALWRLASPTVSAGADTDNPIAWGSITPTPALAGDAITLSGSLTMGKNPASVSVTITCDLTLIGGSATQAMTVSGTTWSYTGATVPTTMVPGHYQLPCQITDDRSRTTPFNLALFVQITPDAACGTTATAIDVIQGSGATSAMVGQTVDVEGVVFGTFQGTSQLGGFFLQEPSATQDSDPATSEAIFIQSTTPVADGFRVHVHGTVAELTSSRGTRTSSLTSLVSTDVRACSLDNTPTAFVFLSLPVAHVADLERYEGMIVSLFSQSLFVAGTNFLGTHGEVQVAPSVLVQPTQTPGDATSWAAQADLNARSTLTLDDGSLATGADLNPGGGGLAPFPSPGLTASNTLRLGQQINPFGNWSIVSGILDDRDGSYRIHMDALQVVPDLNPRPDTTADVAALGGRFRIASAHTLNYFTTLGSRGAQTSTELANQRTKLIAQLSKLNAAVIGLSGVQNFANGQSSGGTYTNAAVSDLATALATATGHTWQFIDTITASHIAGGTITQNGTDAVRSVILYDAGAVTPVGLAALYGQNDANHPSLAQTFKPATGLKADTQTFTVVMNDFASRATACGGTDDDPLQGNCNGLRTSMAANVATWLATNPTADPAGTGRRLLLIGDFNSYFGEDPIQSFVATHGYTNLIALLNGGNAYTASVDAQVGYLDHAMANATLLPLIKTIAEPKINADEPVALEALDSVEKSANAQTAYYAADEFASADRNPVVIAFNPLAGDLNDDGVVDFTDRDLIVAAEGQPTSAVDRRLDFDGDGTITSNDVTLWQNTYTGFHSPQVSLLADPTAGQTPLSVVFVATASDPDNDPLTYGWTFGDGQTAGNVSSVTHVYANPGTYTATVTVSDGSNTAQASATITVSNGTGEPLPPDPATVAPPINPTVATSLGASTAFLYTGTDPIQRGVTPGAIDETRVAVMRGRVLDTAGVAIAGARITVLGAPTLGHTLSRADGAYDLAVNGGAVVTIQIEKDGYLPVQRRMTMPWHDYVPLEEVRMTALDPVASEVHFDSTSTGQRARASVVSDNNGQRQATIIVPEGGVHADIHMPDGTVLPDQSSLHIRATEYTVGPHGPQAMPAALPSTSGYTYAIELSADEATQAGAKSMTFSPALAFYVENYIGFPVGIPVPSGFYDRERAAWIASDDGLVIKVLSVNSSGLAELDLTGGGQPADATALADVGITEGERRQLAELYQPGRTLWRIPIAHFSTYDFNFPYGLPDGAESPGTDDPDFDRHDPDACPTCGSIIESQNQTLGEEIPVAGTAYTLNYRSSRMPGFVAGATVGLTLSKIDVPAPLKRIEVDVTVGGQKLTQTFTPQPNLQTVVTWNGRDAYNRPVYGFQHATVKIRYIYNSVFFRTGDFKKTFNSVGTAQIVVGNGTYSEFGLERQWDAKLVAQQPQTDIAGWSFNVHHSYDSAAQKAYLGDGSQQEGILEGFVMHKVRENTTVEAVQPDGAIVARTMFDGFIRIDRSGVETPLPALVMDGECGSGFRMGFANAPDGTLYYADRQFEGEGSGAKVCIGRIKNGVAEQIAVVPFPFVIFSYARVHLAFSPDGNLFIATSGWIWMLRPGETEALLLLSVGEVTGLAVGPDGNLYFAVSGQFAGGFSAGYIYRYSLSTGQQTLIAGAANAPGGSEGALATDVFMWPSDLSIRPDGTLVFINGYNSRIQQIVGGRVRTIAGGGALAMSFQEGMAARQMSLMLGDVLAQSPSGEYYVNATGLGFPGLYRMNQALADVAATAYVMASSDGSHLFEFDIEGRHLRTRAALSGVVIDSFEYDGAGRLTAIVDLDGLRTTITRNGDGTPTAIVAPFGQQTSLAVDGNGWLSTFTDPTSRTTQFGYTPSGLLTSMTKPNGGTPYTFVYDALGRLQSDQDPAGGAQTLTRTALADGNAVTNTQNAGHSATYTTEHLANGDQRTTITGPDGLQTVTTLRSDGTSETVTPTGMHSTAVMSGEPRFGMQRPMVSSTTLTTPGSLSMQTSVSRSVVLADPADITSLQTQTDTSTVNGRSSTAVYDVATRTLTETSAGGRQSVTTYDTKGRVVQTRDGNLLPITFGYDAGTGFLTSITRGSRTTTYAYNGDGYLGTRTTSVSASENRQDTFMHDAVGRVTSQTLSGGRAITFVFDNNDNVTSVQTPGNSVAHTFTFTPVDLNQSYTPPGLGTITALHRTDRQVQQITRPDGSLLTFDYDSGSGRILNATGGGETWAWTYSPTTGQTASITSTDGAVNYVFDGTLQREEAWSGTVAGRVNVTYDNNFRPTSQSVNGTSSISFGYDPDGLLMSAGALTIMRDTLTGMMTGTTVGNVSETRTNDPDYGELSDHTYHVMGTPIYNVSLTRDRLGRATTQTETLGAPAVTDAYSFDPAGRLTEVRRNGTTIATYTYDLNGNRLLSTTAAGTVSATYDAADRLLTWGTTSYGYNAVGELHTKTVPSAGTTTYAYDAFGTLRSVTLPGGRVISYALDAMGRRIARFDNGTRTHTWLYDGSFRPLAELDSLGNVSTRYVFGGGGSSPAYMIRSEGGIGVTYRFVTDTRGSVRLVVNADSGVVAQRIDYDAWGQVLSDSNPGFQPFGFAGGLYDSVTGLVRFGARDYDAETGRWTAPDPERFDGGDTNLYTYAANDPINHIDPSGQDWVDSTLWYGANVSAGFGDYLSFGLTDLIRDLYGLNAGIDHCSWSYFGGEVAGAAYDFATSGASEAMRAAAKGYDQKMLKSVRSRARKVLEMRPKNGLEVHHRFPLKGHPGLPESLFPSAGLPEWLRNSEWNLQAVDRATHQALHANDVYWEQLAKENGLVNLNTAFVRADLAACRFSNPCKH